MDTAAAHVVKAGLDHIAESLARVANAVETLPADLEARGIGTPGTGYETDTIEQLATLASGVHRVADAITDSISWEQHPLFSVADAIRAKRGTR